jgi:hypothetical protein
MNHTDDTFIPDQCERSQLPSFFVTSGPHLVKRYNVYLHYMKTQDQAALANALTTAFDEFISETIEVNSAIFNTAPFAGSWTPAQVVSHIILATDGVPDGATAPLTERSYDAFLPLIRPWWEDLNQKFKSPEALQPDKAPRSKEDLIVALQRIKAKDLEIVAHDDLTLICRDIELPSIGYLTRFEWLWFIQMHLKRHTYQLSRMKSPTTPT